MKIFLFFALFCFYGAVSAKPSSETIVVNIDSVYQRQLVELSGRLRMMETKFDSVVSMNRDLVASDKLFSGMITAQMGWFGIVFTVAIALFAAVYWFSVYEKIKDLKKRLKEHQGGVDQAMNDKSEVLRKEFDELIKAQKAELKEKTDVLIEDINKSTRDACRGMFFEAERRKAYVLSACWAAAVLSRMCDISSAKKSSRETWIKSIENNISLIKSNNIFLEENYKEGLKNLDYILDKIDDNYKERINKARDELSIKYYACLKQKQEAESILTAK